jgi:hypothetical protein
MGVVYRKMCKIPQGGRVTRAENFARWGMAVSYRSYKFLTVSLLKRLCNGHFASETAVWRFHKRNGHLDPEAVKNPLGLLESSGYNSFSRLGRWSWL